MGLLNKLLKKQTQKEQEADEKGQERYKEEVNYLTKLIEQAKTQEPRALAELLMEIIYLFKYY